MSQVRQSRGFKKVLSPGSTTKGFDRVRVYSPAPLTDSPVSEVPDGCIQVTTEVKQQSSLHLGDLEHWPLPADGLDEIDEKGMIRDVQGKGSFGEV